jgi:hypothetical protein
MNRKCIIVINPGETGASNYAEGVFQDIKNYKNFLKSPLGGLWYEHEIETITRPTLSDLIGKLKAQSYADYFLFIFCGHGYYSNSKRETMLELRLGEEMAESLARSICKKQAMILDCCRERHGLVSEILESFSAKAANMYPALNPADCRIYFDKHLAKCPEELVVMYGCEIGQRAGDNTQKGGVYSYCLLDGAEDWWKNSKINTSINIDILSVCDAHNRAVPLVIKERGEKQKPAITKPRTEPYFPFAVIA